ncbi:MAG: hypothetical protein JWO56_1317 [Acidobacteria bacterium]|nr:hypothetical protein [Acidobacteriota bacterium]
MSYQRSDCDPEDVEFDGSFEGTRRRQILSGLKLDPAARLRWLEERMDELFRLQGKATPSRQ